MSMQRPIRVLIGGDHQFVRRSLTMLMLRHGEFQVVGEAVTAEEARDKAAELQPDVVMLDVHLPGESEVEALRAIRSQNPHIRVLILTPHSDDQAVIRAIMAGASGYLPKYVPAQEVVEAVRKVGRGRSLLNAALVNRILERVCDATHEDQQRELNSVEEQILQLVVEGRTDPEIASVVYETETEVRGHVTMIMSKLEVTRRIEATRYLGRWRERRRPG